MAENILQWFPGHMSKAQRLIEENLPLVDIVIELLDARIPLSSQNPALQEIIQNKLRIVALNKSDLADKRATENFVKHFREKNLPAVAVDAVRGKGMKSLVTLAKTLAEEKTHRLTKHGANPRAARIMIVGIPNVGKSSLINRLAGANYARMENRPGVTRAKQWIKIADGLDLLDMPGVLPPKLDNAQVAQKLSWTYAISDEIHELEPTAVNLLAFLAEKYPHFIVERYKLLLPLPTEAAEILEGIGRKRGCIRKGGVVDTENAARIVLSEFREGKLGRATLDELIDN